MRGVSGTVEAFEAHGVTQTVERELGGCPVKHLDFSQWRPMGAHWELAKELRLSCPHFFNTYGDGSKGYWVFAEYDAVRDIYKNPDIFSSESITPWDPRATDSCQPRSTRPTTSSTAGSRTSGSRRRGWTPDEPMIRSICRRLVEETAKQGSCDFVNEWALRFPTRPSWA